MLALSSPNLTKGYILLMDPNMELVVKDKDFESKLKADVYSAYHKNKTSNYTKITIVKKNIYLKYISSTNDYLNYDTDSHEVTDMMSIIDREDDKKQKIRDLNTPRSYFYLAIELYELEKYDESLDILKKTTNLSKEELWYSNYIISSIYFDKEEYEKAIYQSFLTYNMRPTRTEPLLLIAKHFRETSLFKASHDIIMLAKSIPHPKDKLFVNQYCYYSDFDYELSIIAYYLKSASLDGLDISNKLILSNYRYSSVERNLKYYMPCLEEKAINKEFFSSFKDYNPCNPSLLYYKGRLIMNVKNVNFLIMPKNKCLRIDKSEGNLDTKNFRYILDKNLDIIEKPKIFNSQNQTKCLLVKSYVQGFEDVRLFEYKDEIWYVASCSEMNKTPQMVLGNDRIVIPLRYKKTECEKNWLPFVYKDKLLMIYDYSPFEIIEVNPETGICFPYLKTELNLGLRGSCVPIKYKDGYLFAVHKLINDDGRLYYFRLMTMDSDLNIKNISLPFRMTSKSKIQYLMGLEIIEDKIYLSWGDQDKKAYVSILNFLSTSSSEISRIVPDF